MSKYYKDCQGCFGASFGDCDDCVTKVSEDAISREWLIKRWDKMSVRGRTEFDQEIMVAPRVVPKTQIETQNSNENSNEDAISRRDLRKRVQLYAQRSEMDNELEFSFLRIIADAPSVVPKPKEGEWIDKDGWKFCSECNNRADEQANGVAIEPRCTNYCCECGANMKGAE